MKAKGFKVYALSSPGPLQAMFGEQEDVPVFAVEMPRFITPWRDLWGVGRLCCVMASIRPHIVHAHTPKGGLLGMIGAWMMRVPVRIYHIHGLPLVTAKGLKRTLLRWSEKLARLLAHQVLCVSRSVREVAISERLCSPTKVKVLHNGSINGWTPEGYSIMPVSMTIRKSS